MLFPTKKGGKTVGIDIGTTSIKLVEMSKAGRGASINHYAYEALPPDAIVERRVKDVEQVARAVGRALKRSGSKATRAAICVASNSVIPKIVTVQANLGEDQLESLIEVEAESMVPQGLDDISYDFRRLGPSLSSPGEDDVEIVVCRKEVVDDYLTVLAEAELQPVVVDLDVSTLFQVYSRAQTNTRKKQQVGGLVDFGAHASRLMIFHNNQPIHKLEMSYGGRHLTEAIHEHYTMPYTEAIAGLRKNTLPESFKTEVLKPFVRDLVNELYRSLEIFYSSNPHKITKLDSLMITGGCALVGNIEQIIEKRVGVPTSIMNPFTAAKFGFRIDSGRLRREMPSLAIASGLAQRGMSE